MHIEYGFSNLNNDTLHEEVMLEVKVIGQYAQVVTLLDDIRMAYTEIEAETEDL